MKPHIGDRFVHKDSNLNSTIYTIVRVDGKYVDVEWKGSIYGITRCCEYPIESLYRLYRPLHRIGEQLEFDFMKE